MILVDLERVGTKRPNPTAWDAFERERLVGLTKNIYSSQQKLQPTEIQIYVNRPTAGKILNIENKIDIQSLIYPSVCFLSVLIFDDNIPQRK